MAEAMLDEEEEMMVTWAAPKPILGVVSGGYIGKGEVGRRPD